MANGRGTRHMMRIGLISDTHMPERWPRLPSCIFSLFDGVDLILHAGDVGELWVLDELSLIAPVIAVHGNDDTEQVSGFRASELSDPAPVKRAILRISHRCWAGEQNRISREDILREIAGDSDIAEDDRTKVLGLLR